MKFNVISDLHTEFWHGENLMPDEYENLILAGDINIFSRDEHLGWRLADDYGLKKQAKIWIAGNHEYYGNDLSKCYIYPFTRDIEGVRFICATLWTDPSPANELSVEGLMTDFRIIHYGLRRFKVSDMRRIYKTELGFIKYHLHEPFDGKKVVVTHHMPHSMFIADKFKTYSAINDGFASDALEEIPLEDWPAVWVFGHTHEPIDRVEHGTRFVCNPYGYYRRETRELPEPMEIEV